MKIFNLGLKNVPIEEGFIDLPEGHSLKSYSLQPVAVPSDVYIDYGKCEAEETVVRFIKILSIGKLGWKGMSLRRFFAGPSEYVKERTFRSFPAKLPVLTEDQENGPVVEVIPLSTERMFSFWICGLSRLRRLGVLEIREIDGEDYLFPTEKLIKDLEKIGLK